MYCFSLLPTPISCIHIHIWDLIHVTARHLHVCVYHCRANGMHNISNKLIILLLVYTSKSVLHVELQEF